MTDIQSPNRWYKPTISMIKLPHYPTTNHLEKATLGSTGYDIQSANQLPIIIQPLERALVETGFKLSFTHGIDVQIRSRSGLCAKYGVVVANAPGTIDSDYQDEIYVCLVNFGKEAFRVTRGMKIAQLVIAKSELVYVNFNGNITNTKERVGGFGSTGE